MLYHPKALRFIAPMIMVELQGFAAEGYQTSPQVGRLVWRSSDAPATHISPEY